MNDERKIYLAVDLGAGSGRVLAGSLAGGRLELHELNRFENNPVLLPDGWHWDITGLFHNIVQSLKLARREYGDAVVSAGIDTWGVDYALLDARGRLLGLPYQYRDTRTEGMMEKAFEKVPQNGIYEATGIQFIFFNTLFQLLADRETENPALHQASDLLFLPDYLGYCLTGRKTCERTIASTSQLYNPRTRDWDTGLIEKLNLPRHLFNPVTDPGATLGPIRSDLAEDAGFEPFAMVSVAGHDTASAVAAVPASGDNFAYLSSGTWSLMGLELANPVITRESFDDGFTNETGLGGRIRFLKNICGLWLVQESARYWADQGTDYSYEEMARMAAEAAPFRSFIDPDDPRFARPGRMPEKIAEFCRETGQPVPEEPAAVLRCIYESLALRYAEVWRRLLHYAETPPETLHVVGGGAQNQLLNQFTANALNVPVQAGPVEATGIGNLIAQLMADGAVSTLAEGRRLVADSFPVTTSNPQNAADWKEAYARFEKLNPRT